jgi:flagellar biogenesis protein FliO
VEVGSHKLLIASTEQSITTLAHVTDEWLDLSRQEIDDSVKL